MSRPMGFVEPCSDAVHVCQMRKNGNCIGLRDSQHASVLRLHVDLNVPVRGAYVRACAPTRACRVHVHARANFKPVCVCVCVCVCACVRARARTRVPVRA